MIVNESQISDFWAEVTQTIDNLFAEEDEDQARQLMSGYQQQLKQIDENLTFHFERNETTECIEMVIGCDGYAQSIGSVMRLVEAAPAIDGLRVVAFNGRHDPVPPSVQVAGLNFTLEEFWFSLRVEAGALHLSVFLDELVDPEAGNNPRVEAVMVFLDALLGEFDLMTRVASLSWYELPEDPVDHGLLPLAELRTRFDQHRQAIRLVGATLH